MTAVDKIIEEYKKYAQENGFKLNPDKKIIKGIVKGLLDNEKKLGKRYCPCRRITGKLEDLRKVCPCFWHLKDIKADGHCFCWLFVK